MTDIKWPPVPASGVHEWPFSASDEAVIREYGIAVAEAVRGACIAACEAVEVRQFDGYDGDYENGVESGADQCAIAIRAINIGAE